MADPVFVYGSLMFPAVRDAVLRGKSVTQSAVLPDYQRLTVLLQPEGRGNFPAIVPQQGVEVEGILIEAVTEHQLALLDVFEDIESQSYLRQRVEVIRCDDRIDAWAYICGPKLLNRLGGEWCPSSFEANELAEFCKMFLEE